MPRTTHRASVRRRFVSVIVAVLAVASGVAVSAIEPSAALAADPRSDACQTGLLRETAPRRSTECVTSELDQGDVTAATLPAGFQESVAWSGLINPTVVRFAAARGAVVAQKSGVNKVLE